MVLHLLQRHYDSSEARRFFSQSSGTPAHACVPLRTISSTFDVLRRNPQVNNEAPAA